MEVNKLIQLNGNYIKGSISKNMITFDSLKVTINESGGVKYIFSPTELDKLINELTIARNQMDDKVVVSKRTPQFYD